MQTTNARGDGQAKPTVPGLIHEAAQTGVLSLFNRNLGDSTERVVFIRSLLTQLRKPDADLHLMKLDLAHQTLQRDEAALLATCLRHLSSDLNELYLSFNALGDDGIVFLAPALSHCVNLAWLGLTNNGIGDAGAVALAPVFKQMPNLITLGLRENSGIGEQGVAALAPVLASLPHLTVLIADPPLEKAVRDFKAKAEAEAEAEAAAAARAEAKLGQGEGGREGSGGTNYAYYYGFSAAGGAGGFQSRNATLSDELELAGSVTGSAALKALGVRTVSEMMDSNLSQSASASAAPVADPGPAPISASTLTSSVNSELMELRMELRTLRAALGEERSKREALEHEVERVKRRVFGTGPGS